MVPEEDDKCGGKGYPSFGPPPSFLSLGERMSFIFSPSASLSVSVSPLPAPPWNKDDLEEEEDDDEECVLDDEEDEPGGREWD